MALFQRQPKGPVLVFHTAALALADVEQPHGTRAALLDKLLVDAA